MSPYLPEANGVEMNPGRKAAVFSRQSADSGEKAATRSVRGAERTGEAALSLRGLTAARRPPAGNRCEAGGGCIERGFGEADVPRCPRGDAQSLNAVSGNRIKP